jgi:Zn-dependent protease with chaperone function
MSATQAQLRFESSAKKAEAEAERNPGLYKLKLALYGVLGYLVIFALLAVLLAIVGGLSVLAVKNTFVLILLLKKKLIFLLIPVIWVLFRALWVTLEAPQGYVARKKDYPELFAAIDELRKKLKAPSVHQVLITPEFNAAIVQTPRLGVFGWNKNTLILGMELLMVLRPEQAAAVIAHELGHLSGNHSRFAGWIYRVRRSWTKIMEAFEHEGGFGAAIMQKFFHWYAPSFAAYSYALARRNEFEADAMAAELTSPQTVGDALVHTSVAAPYVDQNYWNDFVKGADEAPEPATLPWAGVRQWLQDNESVQEDLHKRLKDQLERQTTYADTHPCLSERLDALGVEPRLVSASGDSAAQVWFADKFNSIVEEFDAIWTTESGPNWRARYDYVQASKAKLAEFGDKPVDQLSDDELWHKANLSWEFVSDDAAKPLFVALQERLPENGATALALAQLMPEDNVDAMLDQLRIAVNDGYEVVEAAQMACFYLDKHNRGDEMQWWIDAANKQHALSQAAMAERSTISDKDEIVPAELTEEFLEMLREQLKATGRVKQAWVAQKKLEHYPESQALVIAVKTKGFFATEDSAMEAVVKELSLEFDFFLLPMIGGFKKMAKTTRSVGVQLF